MLVNQPDDAQLVALWHDPETCPAIARRLGVSQTWLTLQWRRLRQQDRLPTDRRRNASERPLTSALRWARAKFCSCHPLLLAAMHRQIVEATRQLTGRYVANAPHYGKMWIALRENHAAAGTDQAARC